MLMFHERCMSFSAATEWWISDMQYGRVSEDVSEFPVV